MGPFLAAELGIATAFRNHQSVAPRVLANAYLVLRAALRPAGYVRVGRVLVGSRLRLLSDGPAGIRLERLGRCRYRLGQ